MSEKISGELIKQIALLSECSTYSTRRLAIRLGISHTACGDYQKQIKVLGIDYQYLSQFNDIDVETIFHPNFPQRQSKLFNVDADYYLTLIRTTGTKANGQRKKGGYTKKLAYKEYEKKAEAAGERATCRANFYRILRLAEGNKDNTPCWYNDYQPGEAFFEDFVGPTIKYGEHNEFTAYFIVGCFGYSGYQFYRATNTQKTEAWLSFKQDVFFKANGRTVIVVHDNAKPLVTSPIPHLKLNKTYKAFVQHFGFIVRPIPRKSPNFNALAENSAKIFELQVLPLLEQQQFKTLDEINEFIGARLEEINHELREGELESPHEKFYHDEQPALLPLPAKPFEMPEKTRYFKPPKDWKFKVDGIKYPIPHHPNVNKVTVLIRKNEIEVIGNGKSLCIHERLKAGQKHQRDPSHIHEKFKKYLVEDQAYFTNWASNFSPALVSIVNAQFNGVSSPDFTGRTACLEIQRLAKETADQTFLSCCEHVVAHGDLTVPELAEAIRHDVTNPQVVDECLQLLEQLTTQSGSSLGDNYVH